MSVRETPLAVAAAILGMEYIPGRSLTGKESSTESPGVRRPHELVGTVGAVTVRVLESRGRTRSVFYFGVGYPSLEAGLRLRRETLLRSVLRLLPGVGDLRIGNKDFDDLLWIKAADATAATAILGPASREAIAGLIVDFPDVRIWDTEIDATHTWSRFRPPEGTDLADRIKALVDAAQTLIDSRP